MKIFVTGGTGYIGNAVVEALCRAGHDVSAMTRSVDRARSIERYGARAIEGDLRTLEKVLPVIRKMDGLIHLAAESSADLAKLDQQAVEVMLDALSQSDGLRRFIYTSGVWVLGDTAGKFIDESASTDHPLPLVAWRASLERKVLSSTGRGITSCVIRPGVVYGGFGGLIGMLFASAAKQGAVQIVGNGENHWALVHREDLADLYVRAVDQGPAGQVFNATDGSRLTVRSIAEALSAASGHYAKVNSIPLADAKTQMGPLADALSIDQEVFSWLAGHLLDWTPRHRSLVAEADALFRSFKAGP